MVIYDISLLCGTTGVTGGTYSAGRPQQGWLPSEPIWLPVCDRSVERTALYLLMSVHAMLSSAIHTPLATYMHASDVLRTVITCCRNRPVRFAATNRAHRHARQNPIFMDCINARLSPKFEYTVKGFDQRLKPTKCSSRLVDDRTNKSLIRRTFWLLGRIHDHHQRLLRGARGHCKCTQK